MPLAALRVVNQLIDVAVGSEIVNPLRAPRRSLDGGDGCQAGVTQGLDACLKVSNLESADWAGCQVRVTMAGTEQLDSIVIGQSERHKIGFIAQLFEPESSSVEP